MRNRFGRKRSHQQNRTESPQVHTMMRVDRRRVPRPGSDVETENTLRCVDITGADQLTIDGEVYHQQTLRNLAGSGAPSLTAALVPEQNKFDPTAVVVYIDGHKCGYMPSSRATSALGNAIRACVESTDGSIRGVACTAIIGRDRSGAHRVTLSLDTKTLTALAEGDLAAFLQAAGTQSQQSQAAVKNTGTPQAVAPRFINTAQPLGY